MTAPTKQRPVKWLIIFHQQYSENTPEYGCGDYPDQIAYIGAVVEATTFRKAQAAAKKLFPRIRFGRFGAHAMRADDDMAYLYTKPHDPRLREQAQYLHDMALCDLEVAPRP